MVAEETLAKRCTVCGEAQFSHQHRVRRTRYGQGPLHPRPVHAGTDLRDSLVVAQVVLLLVVVPVGVVTLLAFLASLATLVR